MPVPPASTRRAALVLLATLFAFALPSGHASATGAILSESDDPIELRVALSLSSGRSTLWTQLHLKAGGTFALVVPAPIGASLDWSTEAWLEGLQVATVPRVVPPPGSEKVCPGEPADDPVHIVADTNHAQPLAPLEVAVMQDTAEVKAWAQGHGLALGAGLEAALDGFASGRYVVARFTAAAEVWTPVLRVVSPSPIPVLPLALTQSHDQPLRITSWVIAEGRAELTPGPELAVDPLDLVFDVAAGESNYGEQLDEAFGGEAITAHVIEAAGHAPLGAETALPDAAGVIDSLATAYFARASAYLGGLDAPTCIVTSKALLSADKPVAYACPRADLGVVGGGTCSEPVQGGEIDPDALRCTPAADDLAVAMSGLVPAATWITRHVLSLPAATQGLDLGVTVTQGKSHSPVVLSDGGLDYGGCKGGGSSSSSSSSSSSGSTGGSVPGGGAGGSSTVRVPVYEVHESCGSRTVGNILYYEEIYADDAPDAYYYDDGGCTGDTSGSYEPVYDDSLGTDYPSGSGDETGDGSDYDQDYYGEADDCGGESSDGYDSGDDCQGETSDGYDSGSDDCSGDSSGSDDCGGDSSDGYDGGDCGGDSGSGSSDLASGCDGGDAGDCAIATRRSGKRYRRPRLSVLVVGALCFLVPLRRHGRPNRRRTKPLTRAR